MDKLFCKLGRCYLINYHFSFTDKVTGDAVFDAECSNCEKKYMVDSLVPIFGFRVLSEN
jgi:hypothetical protein